MLWYHRSFAGNSWRDWLAVLYHGLPLDISLSAYLSAVPMLIALVGIWLQGAWRRVAEQAYYGIAALLVALTFVVNIGLYDFWKFPLDAMPVFYFFTSPADAFASVSLWFVMGGCWPSPVWLRPSSWRHAVGW